MYVKNVDGMADSADPGSVLFVHTPPVLICRAIMATQTHKITHINMVGMSSHCGVVNRGYNMFI